MLTHMLVKRNHRPPMPARISYSKKDACILHFWDMGGPYLLLVGSAFKPMLAQDALGIEAKSPGPSH